MHSCYVRFQLHYKSKVRRLRGQLSAPSECVGLKPRPLFGMYIKYKLLVFDTVPKSGGLYESDKQMDGQRGGTILCLPLGWHCYIALVLESYRRSRENGHLSVTKNLLNYICVMMVLGQCHTVTLLPWQYEVN